MRAAVVSIGIAGAAFAFGPARAESLKDWEWMVTPYVWGPNLSLDVSANGDPVIGSDVSVSNLLEKTDIVGALDFRGQCVHAGFSVNAFFVDLGDQKTLSPHPPLPGGTVIDADVKMGVYEAAGFYRFGKSGVDLIAGVRLMDTRIRVDATVPAPIGATRDWGTDKTFVDGFGGVRYSVGFAKRWRFAVQGDAGAGGTDLTWQAAATFAVRFGKTDHYHLVFGWRHLDMDVTETNGQGTEIETEQVLSGAVLGFTFKF